MNLDHLLPLLPYCIPIAAGAFLYYKAINWLYKKL
jgi:hypothetical protein